MKRSIRLAFAVLLLIPLLAGCGEKNHYRRNLDFINDTLLGEERQARAERLDEATKDLNDAVASGNAARIEEAKVEYQLAWERLDIAVREIQERDARREATLKEAQKLQRGGGL